MSKKTIGKIGGTIFVIGVLGFIFGYLFGLDEVRMQATDRQMLLGIGMMLISQIE